MATSVSAADGPDMGLVDPLLHGELPGGSDSKRPGEPDMDVLASEYEDVGGGNSTEWRSEFTERARFTRWTGQSADGRKHREALNDEPKPWENASDVRVPLVDEFVLDLKTALKLAFNRAQLKVIPLKAEDTAKVGAVEQLVDHYRTVNRREWMREIDLLADYIMDQGMGVLQVDWDEELAIEREVFDLEALNEFENGPDLKAIILDPEQEDTAIAIAQDVLNSEGELLSRKQAKKIVKSLRESGSAEVPVPYVRRKGPTLCARKQGTDVFFPKATTDMERARCIHVRDFLSETELRENVVTDGWAEDWVPEALKTRGQVTLWDEEVDETIREDGVDGVERVDSKDQLVEVVWSQYRQLNEDGLPEVMVTVWCPHCPKDEEGRPLYAKHGPKGHKHGKMGFIAGQQERLTRRLLDSRGVAEIAATWQDGMKRQEDMLNDRADMEINPSLLVPARVGEKYRIGPGVKLKKMRQDGIEFLDPPKGNPQLAFELMNWIRMRACHYWGLPHPDLIPQKWQARLQARIEDFLALIEEAFTQVHQLACQYVDAGEFAEMFGMEKAELDAEAIAGEFHFQLVFDARDLDMEFTYKKLDAINKLAVPLDRAGTIDYGKLVAHVVNAIDPQLGRVLMADPGGAAQKVKAQVDQDIQGMALGNAPEYVELDPTAGMKLQFAEEIVAQNPKYQQALFTEPGDERFKELMDKYQQNLEQSVAQLGDNVMAGRTGVKPDAGVTG